MMDADHKHWGALRSILHDTRWEVLERATKVEALLNEHSFEKTHLRHYILDLYPSWNPTSPKLPYALIREWMEGRLCRLLHVVCQDEELCDWLEVHGHDLTQAYIEFAKAFYSLSKSTFSTLSYGGLHLSLLMSVYERISYHTEASTIVLVHGKEPFVQYLSVEDGQKLLASVLAQEMPDDFERLVFSFQEMQGFFECGGSLGWVDLVCTISGVEFEYHLFERGYDVEILPALTSLFRFFSSIEIKDVFLHDTIFDEPLIEERRGVEAVQELWEAYRRLCGLM